MLLPRLREALAHVVVEKASSCKNHLCFVVDTIVDTLMQVVRVVRVVRLKTPLPQAGTDWLIPSLQDNHNHTRSASFVLR